MSETILNLDIIVPNQTRYLRVVGNIAEQIAKELDTRNCDRDTLAYHFNLVLTEAVANAIQYSGGGGANETALHGTSIAPHWGGRPYPKTTSEFRSAPIERLDAKRLGSHKKISNIVAELLPQSIR